MTTGSRPDELPAGWRLSLDRSVSRVAGGRALVGGTPPRLTSLTDAGRSALDRLLARRPGALDRPARRLGRRLVDAGMAHPRLPAAATGAATGRVTVVVPVRDRADDLDRCLGSLGPDYPVLVVDDGSADPASVAAVCRRHRARLLARPSNGGPAAARNEGLAAAGTDLVAFVDSDCRVTPDAVGSLVPYFDDPSIGAVAPRIRPDRGEATPSTGTRGTASTVLERYASARSALDLGADEGPVGANRGVRYVPAAMLVVRRQAFGSGFDPDLRVGEDVDFVWRLGDRGWQVRYVPSVVVHHREPDRWGAHLARRYRYGTSAGPLARRHPDRMAPVELFAAPAVVVAALARGRVGVAVAAWVTTTGLALRRMARTPVPPVRVLAWQLTGPWSTFVGLARATATVVLPGLPLLLITAKGRRWRLAGVLVLLPALLEWVRRRPDVGPARWVVASLADDLAYGAGVWVGCARSGTVAPLVPSVRFPRPTRFPRSRPG